MCPIWRSVGLEWMARSGAKHGGVVRSRRGWRQGTGMVVAGVSRKIVTLTGWR